MFFLVLFPFLFVLPLTAGPSSSLSKSGVELHHNNQTELEINLLDQCMANAEVGPNGQFESAMRFHFLVARKGKNGQNCTGSVLMCYPGQLDPNKNFGLTMPTMQWSVPNLGNNSIAEDCNRARNRCLATLDQCSEWNTPWHGVRISYNGDSHLDFEMSIGGSYKIPLTNFTLMLHNNEVHDEADPTAFLIDDFDGQDICENPEVFPIAGQDKPLLYKIPLLGNDANYSEWKKLGGYQKKLEDYPHLFRLSWDMLPKTQLEDNEMLYIWTDNSTAKCDLRAFFMDRMQRTVDNFEICIPTTVAPTIPSDVCPSTSWMPIKAAKLDDEFGKELTVRVGFIGSSNAFAEADYLKYRDILMASLPGHGVALNLPLGDYYFASVQDHFNMNVSNDHQHLEALVYNCTFGTVSTRIRSIKRDVNEPNNIGVHELLDWSKSFEDVCQCNRSQQLLASQKLTSSLIQIEANDFETGIRANNEIDIKAHQYKYGYFPRLYRKRTMESFNNHSRVRQYGRFISRLISLDIYHKQHLQSLEAIMLIDDWEMINMSYKPIKPSEFVMFGLFAVQYKCQHNVVFLLPRFDVVILNGSEPVHWQNESDFKGNWANRYILNDGHGITNIEVNREKKEECWYDFDNEEWMEC